MLAYTVWALGGQTAEAPRLRYVARTEDAFPHFVAEGLRLVATADEHNGPVVVHMLPHDPSPAELCSLARRLRSLAEAEVCAALVLVGSLRPSAPTPRGGVPHPQMHGLVLWRDRLPAEDVAVLPCAAVEHGWFLCVRNATVCAAFQAQAEGHALTTVAPPAFAATGYRLWRKGQTTYALVPRTLATANADEWDAAVRSFLQDLC